MFLGAFIMGGIFFKQNNYNIWVVLFTPSTPQTRENRPTPMIWRCSPVFGESVMS